MRDCRDDDVGADGQGVLVAVAVGVRVGELLPAVAEVEPAVDDGQPAVEGDALTGSGRSCAPKSSATRGVYCDPADVVVGVIERVVERKVFEPVSRAAPGRSRARKARWKAVRPQQASASSIPPALR